MRTHGLISVVALLAALSTHHHSLGAEPTSADKSSAKISLEEGTALAAKGDHPSALIKFKAAYGFAPTPVTGLALGRGYLAVGKLVDAREMFAAVEAMPKKPTESKASDEARTTAAKLKDEVTARIPLATLKITGVPLDDKVRATLDSHEVRLDTLGVERRLDPGEHVFAASALGVPEVSKKFTVEEKDQVTVLIELHPPPVVSPTAQDDAKQPVKVADSPSLQPSKDPTSGSPWRTVGFVTAGAGVLGAGVGAWLYLSGRSSKADLAERGCFADSCPLTADAEAFQSADAKAKNGTALLVVGSVLLVGGVTLIVLSPSGAKRNGQGVARVERVTMGGGVLMLTGSF